MADELQQQDDKGGHGGDSERAVALLRRKAKEGRERRANDKSEDRGKESRIDCGQADAEHGAEDENLDHLAADIGVDVQRKQQREDRPVGMSQA